MTVKEVREMLATCSDDAPVVVLRAGYEVPVVVCAMPLDDKVVIL